MKHSGSNNKDTKVRNTILPPELEYKLAGLRFPFPSSVEGRLAGVHSSPQPGASVEFAEHKEYAPGDDLRHLNWKAYARTDKFYIRRFTRDTHADIYIMLDESGSMDYASAHTDQTKLRYGARLATALAYLFLHQNDAVGLVTARGEGLTHQIPARSHPSQLVLIQETLQEVFDAHHSRVHGSEGTQSLARGFEFLVSRKLSRSALFVITDLFLPDDTVFPFLSHLRNSGNFCWLIQTLDPAEWDAAAAAGAPQTRTFPFDGTVVFKSPETGTGLLMDARVSRPAYVSKFGQWLNHVEDMCAELGINYTLCNTDTDILEVILKYLLERR